MLNDFDSVMGLGRANTARTQSNLSSGSAEIRIINIQNYM